jgi:enoyl-CoA hydratase/carnithine racemase
MQETIHAIKELDEDLDTVFTVLTGEGRFFSAGADVRGTSPYLMRMEQTIEHVDRIWT